MAADKVPLPADHAEREARGLVQFKDRVAPLLKQHCLKCHGGEKTRGEFDISTREGLIAGGPSGTAIVPFSAKDSLLYKLITHAEEPAMPDGQDKLPDDVIAKIGAWIDNGAPYEAPLIAGKKSPKEASARWSWVY